MTRDNPCLTVVVAHPDDEVLGCAATVKKFVNKGWDAHLIIATPGISGRLSNEDDKSKEQFLQIEHLKKSTQMAASLIGYKTISELNFPDNRLDTISRMDLSHAISNSMKNRITNIVFTHHPGDYNWDHGIVFDAVLMATRCNPPDNFPSELRTFEVLSSTERSWQGPNTAFHPNCYVDIEKYIDEKKLAMSYYKSEYRDYPHPRSLEGIEYLARKRGNEVGLKYAEAFNIIRRIE